MAFRWTKEEKRIIELLDVVRWQGTIQRMIQRILRTAIELGKLPGDKIAEGEISVTRLLRSLDTVNKDLDGLARQIVGRDSKDYDDFEGPFPEK